MKKTKFSVLVYVLAMMLVMYNCKKKEEPFPTEPDKEKVEELEKVKVETVTITPPAPVVTTAATAEVSPKATAVNGALDGIAASGVVPASVSTAAAEVSAALPAADVATLAAVTPATIAAISSGGPVSAELQVIMDKVAANPAVQAYLPKFTLPTVAGKPVTGRVGVVSKPETVTPTVSRVSEVEAVQVEDACIISANAAFETVKAGLDASRTTQTTAINAAYTAAIAPGTTTEAQCKAGVPTTFAVYRAGIKTQVDAAMADLAAAQTVLGSLYPTLVALVNIQAVGAYSGLNKLENASLDACTQTTGATVASAQAARDANLATLNTAYNTALSAANAIKVELLTSCHNQGGGQ